MHPSEVKMNLHLWPVEVSKDDIDAFLRNTSSHRGKSIF